MNYIFYNTKPFEISFLVQCIVYSISEQCRTCTGKPVNPGRKTFLVPYSIFKVLQQGLFFFQNYNSIQNWKSQNTLACIFIISRSKSSFVAIRKPESKDYQNQHFLLQNQHFLLHFLLRFSCSYFIKSHPDSFVLNYLGHKCIKTSTEIYIKQSVNMT